MSSPLLFLSYLYIIFQLLLYDFIRKVRGVFVLLSYYVIYGGISLILSVSRRTDIPAFYTGVVFMGLLLENGFI